MDVTLNQIGEKELLNRLKRFMPNGQIDDDTTEIYCSKKNLIINTDVLVENVHFSKLTTSPNDVGWRALAANLSDLASSGADQIIGINVGLVVPEDTNWSWVEGVYQGMTDGLRTYGGNILGGDCSKGKEKLLAITAFGTSGKLKPHRSNALPGDSLVVTGPHGLSRLGLALLLSDPLANKIKLENSLKTKAIQAYKRPAPPFKALRELERCKPINLSSRLAGTDSSDGLIEAVESLCIASGCEAELELAKLPRHPNWPISPHWDQWCANGGEDFELVLSLPKDWAESFIKNFPGSHIIGVMKSGQNKITWKDRGLKEPYKKAFKHF